MQRPVCALLLLVAASSVGLAACGTVEDEGAICTEEGDETCGRPLDLEYMTAAIFAPSCGIAQCHSTFHQAGGLAFDDPHNARVSLLVPGADALLQFDSDRYDPLATDGTPKLIKWLLPLNEVNQDVGRMPFDSPLPNRDIKLLETWIRAPFTDADGVARAGGSAKGAQCNPNLFNGEACKLTPNGMGGFDADKVRCTSDFNFGEVIESCETCEMNANTLVLTCTPAQP